MASAVDFSFFKPLEITHVQRNSHFYGPLVNFMHSSPASHIVCFLQLFDVVRKLETGFPTRKAQMDSAGTKQK